MTDSVGNRDSRQAGGDEIEDRTDAPDESSELFPTCDRCLLLAGRDAAETEATGKYKSLPLFSPNTWPLALEMILTREL